MSAGAHPSKALFRGEKPLPALLVCDIHDRASNRCFWQVLQKAKAVAVPADAERAFFP